MRQLNSENTKAAHNKKEAMSQGNIRQCFRTEANARHPENTRKIALPLDLSMNQESFTGEPFVHTEKERASQATLISSDHNHQNSVLCSFPVWIKSFFIITHPLPCHFSRKQLNTEGA